jgi:hypothetical protein
MLRSLCVPLAPERRRVFAAGACTATICEALGTAFLLAAVVSSGIMAAKLADGNGAIALLCDTLPTGAILVELILVRRAFQSSREPRLRPA